MAPVKQIFLSTVTGEFKHYRDELRGQLTRPDVSVAVQEDFIASGGTTLLKLDDYIQHCDAVIHLLGEVTGAWPESPAVVDLQQRYSEPKNSAKGIFHSLSEFMFIGRLLPIREHCILPACELSR